MIGILCEKPSARRNFEKALGGQRGNFNGEDYVLVNARGHLYTLADPEKQVSQNLAQKYKDWDLANLPWNEQDFAWGFKPIKDTAGERNNIKQTLSQCDEICCATDVDPSGEGGAIFTNAVIHANLHPQKWSRMYFTDESEKEIQKAFMTRKPINILDFDENNMAFYRNRWDFLSMQFTRIATKMVPGRYLLRQGRLKSAMVVLVGDQLKKISEYKKIPFYQNRFRDENGVVYTNKEEPMYERKEDVPQIYRDSDVVLDSKTKKTSAPPKFLDLAALSSILAPKGMKSKDVLRKYQALYEARLVSYPRTEDKVITPEQFNELLPLVDQIADVVGADKSLLTHRTPRKTHVKTGGAHGANRPGLVVPHSLADLDAKFGAGAGLIYETLAKNYLSTLGEDYEYEQQKGHVKDYPDFKGTANVPLNPGYKAIFSNDFDDEADEDENAKGLGTHANPFIHEGFPPKPQTPTMKWLMKQLEKYNVGTGATRTSTYAEVSSSSKKAHPAFVDKRGKISMTEEGNLSYAILPGTHIGSLDMTAKVWEDMKAVAKKQASPDDLLHDVQRLVMEDMETMKNNVANLPDDLKKQASAGQAKRASGVYAPTGETVTFFSTHCGRDLTDQEIASLLTGGEVELPNLISSKGKPYGVVAQLNPNAEVNGRRVCRIEHLRFAGQDPDGFPKAFGGHTFTQSEKDTLRAGQSMTFTDLVSQKTGSTYTAILTWDPANRKLVMTFPGRDTDGFPEEWCQHKFTPEEKAALKSGQSVQLTGCVSKKSGKQFDCMATWDGKGIKPQFSK